ncbi:MAG: HypC/HybG/HupF family hydrogenase formation chaperone [Actinobacteria bacterium]|nr:MAG: HypC/HybG/HupF family hydrogenase formation chaperone [Actinomycetota bacterium]
MCLGIPARVRSLSAGHPDLVEVDLAGVPRLINVGLLDEPVAPGDWVLVHMGFALSTMTEQEAADALRVFTEAGP